MVPINGKGGVGGKGIASCVWSIKMTIRLGKMKEFILRYFKRMLWLLALIMEIVHVQFDEMIDVGGFIYVASVPNPFFCLLVTDFNNCTMHKRVIN